MIKKIKTRNQMIESIIRPKVIDLIINIPNSTIDSISKLSRESDITISHTHKILNLLLSKELITSERVGRSQRIYLTYEGKELREILIKIKRLIGD